MSTNETMIEALGILEELKEAVELQTVKHQQLMETMEGLPSSHRQFLNSQLNEVMPKPSKNGAMVDGVAKQKLLEFFGKSAKYKPLNLDSWEKEWGVPKTSIYKTLTDSPEFEHNPNTTERGRYGRKEWRAKAEKKG